MELMSFTLTSRWKSDEFKSLVFQRHSFLHRYFLKTSVTNICTLVVKHCEKTLKTRTVISPLHMAWKAT